MKNGMRKTAGILGIVLGSSLAYNTANADHLNMDNYVKCFNEANESIATNKEYEEGEVIVTFRPLQLYPKEVEYFIKSIGYESKWVLYTERMWLIKVPKGKELDVAGKLRAPCLSEIISNAEPNYLLKLRKEDTQK
ncbi:hypothetical protein HYX19_02200 [Candidatus Woesearchaeota archaeon]|nr:hypothetical protein [Candidatus Woesearchaeota archaeon]